MPGFETIVRPVVFPNIRPAPTRSLPPEDDPEKGICTIGGSGGGIIAVTENISVSGTAHIPKETERRVDVARVYQKNDDKTINRSNYIDIEVANRITMKSGAQTEKYYYSPIEKQDNIEIKERDLIKENMGRSQ